MFQQPVSANLKALDRLRTAIQGGRVVALVGAGMSIRSGYPSWAGLITSMEAAILQYTPDYEKLVRAAGKVTDPLWRVEVLRGYLGEDRYVALLRETFRPNGAQPDNCLDTLIALPFRHVLTTNFDRLLEDSHHRVNGTPAEAVDWTDRSDAVEFLYSLHDPGFQRRYVYLHGRYNDPSNMVLSDHDYSKRYLVNNETSTRLIGLLATQQIMFVGFSLTDPAFTYLLRLIKAAMGSGLPRHYAIVALPSKETAEESVERMRLTSLFGVEPVFYSAIEDHRLLCEVIAALADDSKSLPRMAVAPKSIEETADELDDPQKGRWGGLREKNGYRLEASVRLPDYKSSQSGGSGKEHLDLYVVRLIVRDTLPHRMTPATLVRFHLPSFFINPTREVELKNGQAELEFLAWGKFTVGVEIFDAQVPTELELDLAEESVNAPKSFKRH